MGRKNFSTGDFRKCFRFSAAKEDLIKFNSYGTILGATFAALYPVRTFPLACQCLKSADESFEQDKVERMVLDGVADAEDYYASKAYSLFSFTQHLTGAI